MTALDRPRRRTGADRDPAATPTRTPPDGPHDGRQPRWWEPALLPGRWTRATLTTIALLVVMHVVVTAMRLYLPDVPGRDPAIRLFDLDGEMGVPAWFSSLLLVAVAQALWLLGDRSVEGPRRRWVRHDRFLALVFVYLSLDELTALHEQTATPLRTLLDLDGILFWAWVVLFVPLALLLGLAFLGWLRDLPAAAGRLVVLAGVLYVGGAAGMELIGSWILTQGGVDGPLYALEVTVEESMEMLGTLLMLSVVVWLRRRQETQTA